MDRLDEIDLQILGDLGSPLAPQWNARASYASLARKLGVDEETIRQRVKRARDRGVLPAWRIMVNPRLLGFRAASIELEVAEDLPKDRAIGQIRAIPGVTLLIDYRGPGLLVQLWFESDDALEGLNQLLTRICGGVPRHHWEVRYPEPTIRLRPVDWEILDALRDDARADLRAVAARLGRTVRTVQRRLKAMSEGTAFHLTGTPNVEKVRGLICDFVVHCPDPQIKRAGDATIRSVLHRIGAADTSPDDYSIFGVSCENFAQADELLTRLKAHYRTDAVHVSLVRHFLPVTEWLAGQIRRNLPATGGLTPPASERRASLRGARAPGPRRG